MISEELCKEAQKQSSAAFTKALFAATPLGKPLTHSEFATTFSIINHPLVPNNQIWIMRGQQVVGKIIP